MGIGSIPSASPDTIAPPPAPLDSPQQLAIKRRAALATKQGRQALIIDPAVNSPNGTAALQIPQQ